MKIKKRLRRTALLAIAFTISISVLAQQRTITGKVMGEKGRPLPGVTVSVKNKTNAVSITNETGDFSITAATGDVLSFSFPHLYPSNLKEPPPKGRGRA